MFAGPRERAPRALTYVGVLALIISLAPGADAAERPDEPPEPAHASDHVLVKLEPGADQVGTLRAGSDPVVGRWVRVPVPPGKTPDQLVAELRARDGVEAAELDQIIQLDPVSAPVPFDHTDPVSVDDPGHPFQWHFPAIQLDEAWADSTGGGVVVAVVDSGVSQGGEDLDCHTFVSPYNAISGTPGAGAAADDNGHGTHVAGTVAQCTHNGLGVAGVSFDARLMPVKVLDASGSGFESGIAAGIDWARTHGADVINLSLGGYGEFPIIDEAITAAVDAGIVVVAAAGNDNVDTVAYPASDPDVIGVGAVDFRNQRAPYSNRGSALDLVAPGGDLLRDDNGDGEPDGVLQETFDPGWGYYWMNGTSMAAPHVSGAAALLLAVNPGLSPAMVQDILQQTALDLGPFGRDNSYGHGLIQLHDAFRTDAAYAPTWAATARVRVTRYRETSLTLAWDPATDNVGVTGYRLRLAGSPGSMVSGRQSTITGLQPGTTYRFEVLARDAPGNQSTPLAATLRTSRRFADTQGHLFYDDILWLSGSGVTHGCNPPTNDLFCPDDFVTRGQMAAFLVRALGLTDHLNAPFSDDEGTFEADIEKLAAAGITRGCNPPANDLFCPDDFVTRGQMAAFLVRALGLAANTHPGFLDVSPSHTFRGDIGRLATAGITRGCNPPANDRFCPDNFVTRGQMAAFLNRASVFFED